MYRFTVLLYLLLLAGLSLRSQPGSYYFSHLDVRNGVSNNQINAIYKDQDGFMWFGTMAGLNRYDGHSFKVFHHNQYDTTTMVDDYVNGLYEGPGNTLWVQTRSGFNIYDPATEQFNRHPEEFLAPLSIEATGLRAIVKDRQGDCWFVHAQDGLYKYEASTHTAHRFFHKAGDPQTLASNQVSAIAQDGKGDYWIIYYNGILQKMDARSGLISFTSRLLFDRNHGDSYEYHLFIDSDDDLWIYLSTATPQGLYYFNPASEKLQHICHEEGPARLNANLVNSVVQDSKGNLWIGTDHGGINLLHKKAMTIRYLLHEEEQEKSISQNSINTAYKDRQGIIWIGTFKKGIDYYHEDIIRFALYQHQPSTPYSLRYDDVNSFVEEAGGNIWIGTNGGGLLYFNRATGRFTQYLHDVDDPGSLSNNVIVSLCIDHTKKLWIGTYFGGLDCFDGKTFKHYRHDDKDTNSLADDRVWEILEDSRQQLWIGTFANGLDRYDRSTGRFIHHRPFLPNSVSTGYIADLIEDRRGNLWIGTAFGVNVLDKQTGRMRYYLHNDSIAGSLSNNNVVCLLEHSNGKIWIGTRDGLNIFDPATQKITVLRTGDGLPDNAVLTMLEDMNHTVWISTPNGLCNIIVSGENGSRPAYVFRTYDESDGLQGREFNENAALRTRAGELIFGGANGFNLFNPTQVQRVVHKPVLMLTGLQVFNKPVAIGKPLNGQVVLEQAITQAQKINLTYRENVFSIEFAALDFFNTQQKKYAYKLEGFNDDWLIADAKTRTATYTNLDPGDYVFKVKVADVYGNWTNDIRSLMIHVAPPFWKTPWAYLVYFLVVAGILLLSRRITLQRVRMRFLLEEGRREAQRLHELDKMKIRFFTNMSHEFRTPLSLILTPLDRLIRESQDAARQSQLQLVQRNARRLLHLVNQLLDFRKLEVQEIKLNRTDGEIVGFIQEVCDSFNDISTARHIRFEVETGTTQFYTSFDRDKLERILFNLLSNAFKFTPEYGSIRLQMDILQQSGDQHELVLTVTDTGIGIPADKQPHVFERFFQHEVPGSMVNQGSGIGLAITREFVRLHDGQITVDSEVGKGSRFTVRLPLQQKEPTSLPEASVTEEPAWETEAEPVLPVNNKPLVLLVEDHNDFRFYLKDNLRDYFRIAEAVDGREGWQKTLSLHPDLVVSDISMPQMNGIELCRKIKEDKRTAFLPVILLTALTGEEQQLKGLETGANDYMTKPFNFEILLSKIRNQLAQQETTRKAYQKQLQVSPAAVQLESPDEKFMRRALDIIERNISNTAFSVNHLSRELYLSRVALYKKLLALSGKTPVEFIRSIRLQRAAQLLEKKQLTIAEVAYMVGFNNPKYFSRYFKEQFGVLPSAYCK